MDSLGSEIEFTHVFVWEYAWKSENLRNCTEDLYIAVLDAVQAIIKWIGKSKGCMCLCPVSMFRFLSAADFSLVQRRVIEVGKALVQQNEYGKDLETYVKTNVEVKVKAFERAIRACLSQQVGGIDANVVNIGKIMQIANGKLDHNTSELRKMTAAVHTLYDHLHEKLQQLESNCFNCKSYPLNNQDHHRNRS